MSNARRGDWIVMGDSRKLEDGKCLRCGGTFYMTKPVNLEVWCAAAAAFCRVHRRCLKPRAPAPQERAAP